ncbi:MAG: hypothetical protein K6B46_03785 [Opitutales bacterium]|nr:hypothetical protein [Opitutales bacterium]
MKFFDPAKICVLSLFLMNICNVSAQDVRFVPESFPDVSSPAFKALSLEEQKNALVGNELDGDEFVDFLILHRKYVVNEDAFWGLEGAAKAQLLRRYHNKPVEAAEIVADVVAAYLGDEVLEHLQQELDRCNQNLSKETVPADEENLDRLREELIIDFECQRQVSYRKFIHSMAVERFLAFLVEECDSGTALELYESTGLEQKIGFGKLSDCYEKYLKRIAKEDPVAYEKGKAVKMDVLAKIRAAESEKE